MSAIREAQSEHFIPFDSSRKFTANLPIGLREEHASSWNSFRQSVHRLYKARRWLGNNLIYTTGLEKICTQFSMQSENVKVSVGRVNNVGLPASLRIVILSPIPDECRNTQFMTAEIPISSPPEPIVVEAVEYDDGSNQESLNRINPPVALSVRVNEEGMDL